jgi:hypothetical protein
LGTAVATSLLVAAPSLGAPPLKAFLTGQSAPSLPTTFGLPPSSAVSSVGDIAFTAGSGSTLFLQPAGSTTISRLLQAGDPAPGISNSQVDSIPVVKINKSGTVCVQVNYFVGDTTRSGIFTYSELSFTTVALSSDTAPSSSGSVFGFPMTLVGCSDDGVVGFTAPLVPLGAPATVATTTTIFLAAAGGSPVRVAGPTDTAPGTSGGTFGALTAITVSNYDEVIFRAAVSGGAGGYGLFAGSISSVRKIVANGDTNPAGGTFAFTSSSALSSTSQVKSNTSGQVAFLDATSSGIYVNTGGSLAAAVTSGTSVPSPVGGTVSGINGFSTITDPLTANPSNLLFVAGVSGGTSGENIAVLQCTSTGTSLSVVAYKGEAAPGLTSVTFSSFSMLATNDKGDVAFYSQLSGSTSNPDGLFELPSGGSLTQVALDGTTIPGDATTTYNGTAGTRMLKTGDLYFEVNLVGGATYGMFQTVSGVVQKVATDQDPLPAGSRVSLRTLYPKGAGNYVGFFARQTGGHLTLLVENVQFGVTSKVISDGDSVAGINAGQPARVNLSPNAVYVQSSGQVVFTATRTVGSTPFVFQWTSANGLSTVVSAGASVPGTASTFSSVSLPSTIEPPLNATGLIVFKGSYAGLSGLFVYTTQTGTNAAAVLSGSSAPSGGNFTNTFGNYLINSAGQIAFSAKTSTGATGIYVWTPGSTPSISTVAVTGGTAPNFSSFASVTPGAFDAKGEVAFFATLSSGGSGLYLGTTTATPTAIAVSNTAAPSGGNYAFTSSSEDVRLDAFSDILFQAPLTGGSADSGLFLKRALTGLIETVALQGQTASGASYPLATLQPTANNYPGEFTALAPSGEVWFLNPVYETDHYSQGIFRYRLDGTLEKVVMRGDTEPTGLGGTIMSLSTGVGVGAPLRFAFRATLNGGTAADVVYGRPVAAPYDLTGTGAPSVAVFRPSTGTWYIQGQSPVAFGQAGDIPVPADYNGDGVNELAFFRPSDGTWHIQGQSPVVLVSPAQAGDIPVPGDYNGDGVTELAVFRPSAGTWYIQGQSSVSLGQPGDIPVPADYNGDGRTEAAVFRPSTSTWYFQDGTSLGYGGAGAVPSAVPWPDGTSLKAYFQPSTATWYAYTKGSFQFGVAGDLGVVVGASDGANDALLLDYRPGNSTWYLLNLGTQQATTTAFGSVGDQPVFEPPATLLGYPVNAVTGTLGYTPAVALVMQMASGLTLWSGTAALGAVLHVEAVVSGSQGTPTGPVTFLSFQNQACSGVGTAAGTPTLDANGLAQSGTATVGTGGLSFSANYSGDSNYGAASACMPVAVQSSPVTFTDDPLVSGSTAVKAVHVTELRTQINAIRAAHSLPAYSWTNTSLTTGMTVKAVDISDLRAALGGVYTATLRTPPTYTDPTVLPWTSPASFTLIKVAHIAEIRAAVLTW